MKTLNKITGLGDQINTFGVRVKAPDVRKGRHGITGEMITFDLSVKTVSLYQGYDSEDDGIYWGLAHGAMIQCSYTEGDIAEKKRIREDDPVEHDEVVMIDGEEYIAEVVGDYSTCVRFHPVDNPIDFDLIEKQRQEKMGKMPESYWCQ